MIVLVPLVDQRHRLDRRLSFVEHADYEKAGLQLQDKFGTYLSFLDFTWKSVFTLAIAGEATNKSMAAAPKSNFRI